MFILESRVCMCKWGIFTWVVPLTRISCNMVFASPKMCIRRGPFVNFISIDVLTCVSFGVLVLKYPSAITSICPEHPWCQNDPVLKCFHAEMYTAVTFRHTGGRLGQPRRLDPTNIFDFPAARYHHQHRATSSPLALKMHTELKSNSEGETLDKVSCFSERNSDQKSEFFNIRSLW